MRAGDGAILVGVFGAAQGVKGEIRLKSYTGDPGAVAQYGPLTSPDGRSFVLLAVRRLKDDMLVVRVEGITDRTAAERLTNTELFVARDRLPLPAEDEFYHVDLIGLAADSSEGKPIGIVRGVENFGGGDLLEIAPPTGDTILVPFTLDFVPIVDFAARRIVIAPGALPAADETDAEAG